MTGVQPPPADAPVCAKCGKAWRETWTDKLGNVHVEGWIRPWRDGKLQPPEHVICPTK